MSTLRTAPASGLTYVEANGGRVTRLVTFDQAVLDLRERIESLHPRLEVLWDEEQMEHIIVENTLKGSQELVHATDHLDESIFELLWKAFNEDAWTRMERIDAEVEKNIDRTFADAIGDMGEKLAWAFAKDGLTCRPKAFIADSKITNS